MSRKPSPYLPNTLQGKNMSRLHRGPRNGDPTRVYWLPSPRRDPTSWTLRELLDVLSSRRSLNTPEQQAICIIEDITIGWMNRITDYMGLDPAFFANHFDQSWYTQSHPWYWTAESARRHDTQISEENQRWRSFDGKYSLPSQSKTRISYYRPREKLYLFVVDSPPKISDHEAPLGRRKSRGRNRTSLRLRYSTLLQGIFLPTLFDQEHPTYDLFNLMVTAMKHQWLRDCLFVDTKTSYGLPSAVRAHPLVYVLADAAWTHNLRYLTKEVKDVSFSNMEKPRRDTALVMHELREDLDYLKAEVEKAVRYAPPTLATYFEASASSQVYQMAGSPLVFLEQMQRDAAALDEFLTNSLNLLLATIALRDSERADMLTWLAAVYVPLSFVTGIFGMNLRELSDPLPPVWLCLEVLGVVLLVTAAMVVLYKYGSRVLAYMCSRGRSVDRGLE